MRLGSDDRPDGQREVRVLRVAADSDPFGPAVEARLPSGCSVVVSAQRAGPRRGRGLGPQQTVNSLQLELGQDEAVDLLLTAGTRHHDPTHQHRVALLLLFRLKTDQGSALHMLNLSLTHSATATLRRYF